MFTNTLGYRESAAGIGSNKNFMSQLYHESIIIAIIDIITISLNSTTDAKIMKIAKMKVFH